MYRQPENPSPEYLQGQDDSIDDVWSLGILIYQLSMLKLPFKGTDSDDLNARILDGNY
jgi:serine/threonine protein kinase